MPSTVNRAGRLERFFRSAYQRTDLYFEARESKKACRRQLETIKGGLGGSREDFRSEVLPFWSKYGLKPGKMWYELYCYKEKAYEPRYIPGDIYWQRIYPALNKVSFRQAYTDKCFYGQLFPWLKQPRTILRSSNGCFFDGEGRILDFKKALTLLKAEESFVIKPAIHSGEGVDIYFHEKRTREVDIQGLMRLYGSDYIVQEVAGQHRVLSSIHAASLNTIRVISFLFRGEVHISSAILRMGVAGSRLDNVSAGGLACPIRADGSLEEMAIDRKARRWPRHPGGAVFADIRIPSYEKVLEAVREAHMSVPHFRLIGWDFSIDEAENPVLIEYNGAPGMNQLSCGPLFGKLTEPMLDMIFLGADEFSL